MVNPVSLLHVGGVRKVPNGPLEPWNHPRARHGVIGMDSIVVRSMLLFARVLVVVTALIEYHVGAVCPSGKNSNEDATACMTCPIGKYKSLESVCVSCSSTCGKGNFLEGCGGNKAGSCKPCAVGRFNNVETGYISACSVCEGARTTNADRTGCVPCPTGKASSAPGVCRDCVAGQYSNQAEQTACKTCTPGRFQDQVGKTHCIDCIAGKFQSNVGEMFCQDCQVGFYVNATAQTSCHICLVGQFQDLTGQRSCKLCQSGRYSESAGQTFCSNCAVGQYQDHGGSDHCKHCTPCDSLGHEKTDCAGSLAGSCRPCTRGKYNDVLTSGSLCKLCPNGQTNSMPFSSCPPGSPTFVANAITYTHFIVDKVFPRVNITLRWSQPKSDGGSPIVGYDFGWSKGASECGVTWESFNETQSLEKTVPYLIHETVHNFFIRARNAFYGDSQPGFPSPPLRLTVPGLSNDIIVDSQLGNDFTCRACSEDGTCGTPCASLKHSFELANVTGQKILVQPGEYNGTMLSPQIDGMKVVANTLPGVRRVLIRCGGQPCFQTFEKIDATGNAVKYFPTLIDGFVFSGGRAEKGGCVYIDGVLSSVTIQNTVFENCSAIIWGGAVHVTGSVHVMFNRVHFQSNFADVAGGAVSFSSVNHASFSFNMFSRNAAGSGGGVAIVTDSLGEDETGSVAITTFVDILNTTFLSNSAISGDGGAIFSYAGFLSVTNSSLVENFASRYGGGMYGESSTVTLKDSKVAKNRIDSVDGGGGGIGCLSSSMTFTNIEVLFNEATGDGGGGWFTFCSPLIQTSTWSYNKAGASGAGLYFGVMSHPKFLASADGSNINIAHNTAKRSGGGFACYQCSALTVNDVVFEQNVASKGGGMAIESAMTSTLASCSFVGCSAADGGGAIYLYNSKSLILEKSIFHRNSAKNAGGGAILWGFTRSVMEGMSVNRVPLKFLGHQEVNNTAAYGHFVASVVYSLFVLDGPTKETGPKLLTQASGSRLEQKSLATDWGTVAGGKIFCAGCLAIGSKSHYVQVGVLDWYNHFVRSPNTLIKLVANVTTGGTTQVSSISGIGTFNDFVVIAPPGTPLQIEFDSAESSLVRGPFLQVRTRFCVEGEFYNARSARKECTPCATGKYGDEKGTHTQCKDCAAGRYQSEEGQHKCVSCHAGQYQLMTSQDKCIACDMGKYSNMLASVTCQVCKPGTYQDEKGQQKCTPCPSNTYGPNSGSTALANCEQCEIKKPFTSTGPRVGAANLSDCVCKTNYFEENGEQVCKPCPTGASCPSAGTTVATLVTLSGFWRTSPSSVQFYQCDNPDDCFGGLINSSVTDQCADNNTGILCSLCIKDYERDPVTAACYKCSGTGSSTGYAKAAMVGSFVLSLFLILYFLYHEKHVKQLKRLRRKKVNMAAKATAGKKSAIHIRARLNRRKESTGITLTQAETIFDFAEDQVASTVEGEMQGVMDDLAGGSRGRRKKKKQSANITTALAEIWSHIRVLLGYMQITSALDVTFDIPWPKEFVDLLADMKSINIDFLSLLPNMPTVDPCDFQGTYLYSFYMHMGTLPLLVIVISLSAVSCYVIHRFTKRRCGPNLSGIVEKCVKTLIFTIFLMYPGLVNRIFRVFKCHYFDDKGEWLLADLSIPCHTGDHQQTVPWAIVFIGVYVLGIPLLSTAILYRHRKKLWDPNHPELRRIYGSLFQYYRPEFWYFEAIEMTKKMLLTGAMVLVAPGSSAQVMIGILIAVVYLVILLYFKPFQDKKDQLLQMYSTVQVQLTLIVGMAILLNDGDGGVEKSILGMILIALNLSVPLMTAVAVYFALPRCKTRINRYREDINDSYILEDKVHSLSTLPKSEIKKVLDRMKLRRLNVGDVLASEPIHIFAIIMTGHLAKVEHTEGEDTRKVLSTSTFEETLSSGATLGEHVFFLPSAESESTQGPLMAYIALTKCDVMYITEMQVTHLAESGIIQPRKSIEDEASEEEDDLPDVIKSSKVMPVSNSVSIEPEKTEKAIIATTEEISSSVKSSKVMPEKSLENTGEPGKSETSAAVIVDE